MSRPPPPPGGPRPPAGPPPSSRGQASKSQESKLMDRTQKQGNGAFFSESQLPSCKSGFYTAEEERNTRRRTCRFLEEGCKKLRLPRLAISTSMVFFHKFFCQHSFQEKDRFEVAVACILLAAKTEECPKKLIQVIQECYRLKHNSAKRSAGAKGEGLSKNVTSEGYLDVKSEEFIKLKDRILLLERIILHTIGFELDITHPYKHLHDKLSKMIPARQLEYIDPPPGWNAGRKEHEEMKLNLLQKAMNFANDSMHTSLCLQFPPETIAYTCVYLSGQFLRMKPTDKRQWLEILEIDIEDLTSISLQIMELIADRKGLDKKGFESIQNDLKKFKENVVQQRPPPPSDRDVKRRRV